MAPGKTGKKNHDDAVDSAESSRQSATRAPGVSQATVRTAEVTFYRAAVASAKANGVDSGGFIHALWSLGVRDP